MKQYRVTSAIPGRLIGNRFVPSSGNPAGEPTQPLGKLAIDVIALATPAGVTKSGKLRKNPEDKYSGHSPENRPVEAAIS